LNQKGKSKVKSYTNTVYYHVSLVFHLIFNNNDYKDW